MSITLTYEDGISLATQLIQNEIDGKRSEMESSAWMKEADDDALESLIKKLEESLGDSEVLHVMTYEQAVKKIRAYIEYQHLCSGMMYHASILPADMEQALKMIERGH